MRWGKSGAKIRAVIRDAREAGCKVVEGTGGLVWIRAAGRARGPSLQIWPNGTATRTDVSLEASQAIRDTRVMRRVLGIGGAS